MLIRCNVEYKSFNDFEKAMLALGQSLPGADAVDIDETYMDGQFRIHEEWRCGISFEETSLTVLMKKTSLRILCEDDQLAIRAFLLLKDVGGMQTLQPATIPPETYGIREQRWATQVEV